MENILTSPPNDRKTLSQLIIESLTFVVSKIDSQRIDIHCNLSFAIPFPLPVFIEKIAIKIIIKFIKFTKIHFENIQAYNIAS